MPDLPLKKEIIISPREAPIPETLKPTEEGERPRDELRPAAEAAPAPAEGQPSLEAAAGAPAMPVAAVAPVKDRLTVEIETVMAEDLTELFLKMSVDQQQQFKKSGEETASRIRQLLQETKINAKRVLDLIKKWLRLIPGVNKFFLEQEAKIKTDKIILIAAEAKRRGGV